MRPDRHRTRRASQALALLLLVLSVPGAVRAASPPDSLDGMPASPDAAVGIGWQYPAFSTPPLRFTASLVIDAPRRRALLFGGTDGSGYRNDVWAVGLDGQHGWKPLTTAGTPPSPRRHSGAVYDPVRDRMLVFGGFDGGYFQDVWALSLSGTPTWAPLAVAGTPPEPRADFAMAYDPFHDRVLVHGGYDGGASPRRGDLWALSLSGPPAWTPLAPAGPVPSARSGQRAVVDDARHRLLLFGGYDAAARNDTWALSLDGEPVWTSITTSGAGPAPRADHVVVLDAAGERLIVNGGYDDVAVFGDTWALSLAGTPAWSTVATGPGAAAVFGHVGLWDPVMPRLIVVGGYPGGAAGCRWTPARPTSAWSAFAGAGPRRFTHALVPDPPRHRLLLLGGSSDRLYDDAWMFDTEASPPMWMELPTRGTTPPARRAHVAVWDEPRQRILVFGGLGSAGFLNDVWALSLTGVPEWTPVPTVGTPPSPRGDLAAAIDPVGERLVLFGGYDGVTSPHLRVGDAWTLSLSGTPTWAPLAVAGTPPSARSGHRMVYDPAKQRMVMFGGYDAAARNDVWAMDLAGAPTWAPLATAGAAPTPRADMVVAFDPMRRRLLVHGGYDGVNVFDDAVQLDLRASPPAWSPLASGSWQRVYGQGGAWDMGGDRLVIHGGADRLGATTSDTWFLPTDLPVPVTAALVRATWDGSRVRVEWRVSGTAASVGIERREASGDWEAQVRARPDGDARVTFEDAAVEAGRTYAYRLRDGDVVAGEVSVITTPMPRLALRALGCGAGLRPRFACSLPTGERARLELVDVAGRGLGGVPVSAPGPGTIEVDWPWRLPAGLYFARLVTEAGASVTARTVVTR